MTLYNCYNDLHLFGPHAIHDHNLIRDYAENNVLLGDIVDIANALQQDMPRALDMLRRLHHLYNGHFLMGNHERNLIPHGPEYLIENGIYFTHGHYELWGFEKAYDNVHGSIGAGHLKRAGISFIEKMRTIYPFRLRDEQRNRIKQTLERYDCHTFVCGHAHPKRMIKETVGDYRLFILPRGRSILHL